MSRWTLFSNHGHVLLLVAQQPEARLRDIAQRVGITERAVQKIVRDLQDAGMLTVSKHGRRNRYRVHTRKALRHRLESHCTVGQLVRLVAGPGEAPADATSALPGAHGREPAATRPGQSPSAAELRPAPEPEAASATGLRPAPDPLPADGRDPDPVSPLPEDFEPVPPGSPADDFAEDAPAHDPPEAEPEAESESARRGEQGSLF